MTIVFPNISISYGPFIKTYKSIEVPVKPDAEWLSIESKDFAPGIWAGTEGWKVILKDGDNEVYVHIAAIDLHNRRVKVIKL